MEVNIVQIPVYNDIFDGPIPAIDSLIGEISSEEIIKFLCIINSQLIVAAQRRDFETQTKLLFMFLEKCAEEEKERILKKIVNFFDPDKETLSIFSERVTQSFMNYELGHFRVIKDYVHLSENDISIFKAYLVFSQKLDEHHGLLGKNMQTSGPEELFWQQLSWPFLIDQYQYSVPKDITYFTYRIMAFFSFIRRDDQLQEYFARYEMEVEAESIWHYILNIGKVAFLPYSPEYRDNIIAIASFIANDDNLIFQGLAFEEAGFEYNENGEGDFLHFKEKPLFRDIYHPNKFWVFNWNYLIERLYVGILKDFFDRSGISHNRSFRRFPNLLSFVGSEVGEALIFKKLSTFLLKKRHAILKYDDGQNAVGGVPDLYYRIGRYIFLFEFKDTLMASQIVNSYDFESIRSDIHNKFVEKPDGTPKGIGQICKQIEFLNSNTYNFDNFIEKRIKRRNLVIYPVIVYSHSMYAMPGVRDYIEYQKEQILETYDDLEFREIKGTTMIELESFYRAVLFQNRFALKDMIDEYLRRVKNAKGKWKREKTLNYNLKMYPSFEGVNSIYFDSHGKSPDVKLAFELIDFSMEQ